MDYIDLPAMFQQNKYIFTLFGLVILGTIVFNIIRLRKMKSSNQKFLEEHPEGAKVYLSLKALAVSGTVTVHSVDGNSPMFFSEGAKSGFYVIPGTRTVEMSYTHSRPGVIYKNVTKTYGPYKKELNIEANKNYLLDFDKTKETFTFSEI
jgi:hypothetical protein